MQSVVPLSSRLCGLIHARKRDPGNSSDGRLISGPRQQSTDFRVELFSSSDPVRRAAVISTDCSCRTAKLAEVGQPAADKRVRISAEVGSTAASLHGPLSAAEADAIDCIEDITKLASVWITSVIWRSTSIPAQIYAQRRIWRRWGRPKRASKSPFPASPQNQTLTLRAAVSRVGR